MSGTICQKVKRHLFENVKETEPESNQLIQPKVQCKVMKSIETNWSKRTDNVHQLIDDSTKIMPLSNIKFTDLELDLENKVQILTMENKR